MNNNSNIIFIILTACAVAGGAWWYFFYDSGNLPSLTVDSAPTNPAQAHFQTLVSQLKPITINTEILTNELFLSLQDLTTPITEEQKGRPDPFAPISGLSAR